ncbi:rod shape-determining protein [Candidatus Microgenomates bacterium]|nr:rod shape-determining protein [Candidatus Microgenomates bacterium]
MFAKRIGIDLGTVNTLVVVPRRGIVINEPTVVARDVNSGNILAVGKEAEAMVGRTPETIELYRPLSEGVIADFQATQSLLKHYINQAIGRLRPIKPDIMISVPGGATSTERKAVVDVAIAAGGRSAYIIAEPVASALGANVPIAEAAGNLVIEVGGGTTEIAVISLGGIVAQHSVRVGGNKIDAAISEYLRRQHSLSVGDKTAESVKQTIGSAMPAAKQHKMEVKGRDVVAGLPKTVTVSSGEIIEPIQDILEKIVLAIRTVLEHTQPELVSDIIDRGIILSGGSALLKNLDKLLVKVIGVPVVITEDPLTCVAQGIGIALANLSDYQKSLLVST